MIGSTLSHYRITAELGRGGMGVVYLAEDLRLGRQVAIKLLPGKDLASDDDRARFYREAHVCASLNHPNVATLYEVDEDQQRPFLVLEYLEGGTLAARLKDGALPVKEAADIARQVGEGLHAAHEKGIVHRDVKAGNAMFTSRGSVKVLDFGLAKLAEAVDITKKGSTVGTIGYMSPEQVRGESVTWASDAWSLGVLLYEMVAGKKPFAGSYEAEVTYRILQDAFEPLSAVVPNVPTELDELVNRLLSKEPGARGESLVPTIETLARLSGSDVPASSARQVTAPAATPAGASVKRHMSLPLVGGVAAVLVALVTVIWVLSSGGADPSVGAAANEPTRDGIAVLPFTVRGDTSLNYLGEGIVSMLSSKIDGVGDLRSTDDHALLGYLSRKGVSSADPIVGKEVAREFGAREFILGDISRVGGPIRFAASRYDADGTKQQDFEVTAADDAGILRAIDDLARNLIAERVGETGSQMESMAALASASFPALREQLRGEAAFRAGEWVAAYTAFRKAVDIDSTFALAWFRLGTAAGWGANPREEQEPAYENALRLGQNLPERTQKKILAALQFNRGQFGEAERVLLELTRDYPDDTWVWYRLGDLLFHYNIRRGRSYEDALDPLRRAFALDPTNVEITAHLLQLEAETEEFQNWDQLLATTELRGFQFIRELASDSVARRNEALAAIADSGRASLMIAARYAMDLLEDPTLADTIATVALDFALASNDANRASNALWRRGRARLSAGRIRDAWADFAESSRYDPSQPTLIAAFMEGLGRTPTPSDQFAAVEEQMEWIFARDTLDVLGAVQGRVGVVRNWMRGMLAVARGDYARAREMLSQLDRASPTRESDSVNFSFARQLEGTLASREGRRDDAIRALEQGEMIPRQYQSREDIFDQTARMMQLARLYYEVGRRDEALRLLIALGDGSWDTGSSPRILAPYLGEAFLMRARIYDDQGRVDDAIKFYTRFLEVWQRPDPELQPQVDDARNRLDELLKRRSREPSS